MIDQLAGESLATIALPTGATPVLVFSANDRRTSLEINTIEATTGPISHITLDAGATAPADATEMRQFPIGGLRVQDGTGVPKGDVYVLAPAGVGSLKLVETT